MTSKPEYAALLRILTHDNSRETIFVRPERVISIEPSTDGKSTALCVDGFEFYVNVVGYPHEVFNVLTGEGEFVFNYDDTSPITARYRPFPGPNGPCFNDD